MDSTKPASRSTRRCLDTIGCGMPSCRSISPTDCCDETSRLRIARRFGSAMISNTDSILLVYATEHIRVKVYKGRGPRRRFQNSGTRNSGTDGTYSDICLTRLVWLIMIGDSTERETS